MADLKDWGQDAADNNVASPDGAQSGWLGADVGPWARETMAAVARWYGEPAWVNFAEFGFSVTGNKTITRLSDTSIQISTTGASWSSADAEIFAVGRVIRVQQSGTNTWHHGFIVSVTGAASSTLTVTLSLIGVAALSSGWTFVTNGLEFYGGQSTVDTLRPVQVLGAQAFSGYGTTAERDARFPDVTDVPAGVLWGNSTTSMLQMVTGAAGSRAWVDIAPLASAWSDAGGIVTLNSATNAAVLLQEAGTTRSRFVYDANTNRTILEGGDVSGTAGWIFIDDADGKAYYRNYTGGTPGSDLSLTPGEIVAAPANDMVVRTGAGLNTLFTAPGTPREIVKGTLPSAVQEFLEGSSWDTVRVKLHAVVQTLFAGVPSASGSLVFNLFLGNNLDSVAPADLNANFQARYEWDLVGNVADPYVAYIDGDRTSGEFRDQSIVSNADLTGTVNSFYISAFYVGVGSSQNFDWRNSDGNFYSSLVISEATRLLA